MDGRITKAFNYYVDRVRKKFGPYITSETDEFGDKAFECNISTDDWEISRITVDKSPKVVSVVAYGKFYQMFGDDIYAISSVDVTIDSNGISVGYLMQARGMEQASYETYRKSTLEEVLKNTALTLFPTYELD